MIARKKSEPSAHLIGVKNGMDELDVLDERLDRLLDRLNDLWDRAVGVEREPSTPAPPPGAPGKQDPLPRPPGLPPGGCR